MQTKSIITNLLVFIISVSFISCNPDPEPLDIPSEYVSANFETNTISETTVINELSELADALNIAEANAQSETVSAISYPTSLASVTLSTYKDLIDSWLIELVKAANSSTGFQMPDANGPANGEEGGLLGSRLLDENGLELEQMIEKGSFSAAFYNHALSVVNGNLSSSASIDQLIKVFGTDISFNAETAKGPAKYAKRRSNNDSKTGVFYDIKTNLITAKAAIEAGEDYNTERDEALDAFLLNWEKSNFATVINYCNATKLLLQEATSLSGEEREAKLGDAMHAYAEGVGFTSGLKGIAEKQITDAQIDAILDLLLAPIGETPTSYRFLNQASLLANLDQIIDDIKAIYDFTDEEVISFYANN
ncbi:MAG: hypothetical protein JXQ87_16715 [Bacteroidia bacterium]